MRSLLLLPVFVLAACRYSPSDSGTGGDTSDGGLKTSTVRGTVTVEGKSDSLHTDYSGVRIEILDTKLSAVSNQLGFWSIDSVPAGSYDILYSRDGYDSVLDYSVQVLPPVGARLGINELMQAQTVPYRIDTVWPAGPYPLILLSALDSTPTRMSSHCFAAFAGHTREVGPLDSQHDVAMFARLNSGGGNYLNFSMSRAALQQSNTLGGKRFKSGDSVYLKLYTCGTYYAPQVIYDANGTKSRWMNLRNPSPVVGFVLP